MARFIGLLPRQHLREFRIYIFVTKKEEHSINKYIAYVFHSNKNQNLVEKKHFFG
jgi:hypothetical protein